MAPPAKPSDRRKWSASKERDSDDAPSLNLWVGDLAPDTDDADLMAIFKDYGAMDALTSYTPRTYAFVFFRNTEDAKKAMEKLQGSVVRGSSIKVQLARPVCSHLLFCNRNLMCIDLQMKVMVNLANINFFLSNFAIVFSLQARKVEIMWKMSKRIR